MRLITTIAIVLLSAPAWASECVGITFKDMNGLPVPTEKPLAGLVMSEGDPLVDFDIPAGVQLNLGVPMACPSELLASVQNLFKENCVTSEQRAATAKANNNTVEAINGRCKDIYKALGSK